MPDPARSIPPEFDERGAILQGHLATRAVPPWTPFETDEAEADRLVRTADGIKIPTSLADALDWLLARADELRIPRTGREHLLGLKAKTIAARNAGGPHAA